MILFTWVLFSNYDGQTWKLLTIFEMILGNANAREPVCASETVAFICALCTDDLASLQSHLSAKLKGHWKLQINDFFLQNIMMIKKMNFLKITKLQRTILLIIKKKT